MIRLRRSSTSSTASISDESILDSVANSPSLAAADVLESNNKHHRAKKSVSFGAIEIREYPLILGDNPSVTSGPPLSLDWIPQSHSIFDLDEYDNGNSKASPIPPRTSSEQMRFDEMIRFHILQNSGYTLSQIANATIAARRVQDQRRETMQSNLRLLRLQQTTRSVRRKLPSFHNISSRKSFGNKEGFIGKIRKNSKNLKKSPNTSNIMTFLHRANNLAAAATTTAKVDIAG